MLVAILALLGLGMIALAVWLVRSTRTDPQALGPLEVMGDRRWRKGDSDRRKANLDTARPASAGPPGPMVGLESGDVDGDTAGGSTADAVAAEAELAEGSVGEPVAGEGGAGEGGAGDVGASDAVAADRDATDHTGAAPSQEQSSVSAHASEGAPTDSGSTVEADKTD
jgi:hypothetical protein